MAHSYAHLFRLPATGLRFFTVYGPWGRPGHVADALHQGHPRRATDPGVQPRQDAPRLHVRRRHRGRRRAHAGAAAGDRLAAEGGGAPHAIYNIGNHEAVELETFIATLEELLGRTAIRDYQPMQPGDVPATYASIDRLRAATGFAPRTPLAEGLARFVEWYRGYYR